MTILKSFGSPLAAAVSGLLSMAVAMGVGRFAATPMMPLMIQEGGLTIAAGGWLAAANYLGYLLGALSAARLGASARALAAAGLSAIALTTAAMALQDMAAWMALRFAAGLCSAWVFVATSVWCLGALGRHGRPDLAGWVYAGVGAGIALAGLYVLGAAASGRPAGDAWLRLGAWSAILSLPVCLVLAMQAAGPAPAAPAPARGEGGSVPAGTRGLVACYGLMGFGYILPATFLPVLAQEAIGDPRVFGLAWPLFGAVACVSTLAAGRWVRRWGRLPVWGTCQAVMGVGALLPGLRPDGPAVFASALCVGGTFMAITLVGIQEIRARAGADAAAWVGHFTAAFAAGQIAGPVVSAVLTARPGLGQDGLRLALLAAAVALLASAAWILRRASRSPTFEESPHVR